MRGIGVGHQVPEAADHVGDWIASHDGVKNPLSDGGIGVDKGDGEESAAEEPHGHEDKVHDGVEALGAIHGPSEADAERGESDGGDSHKEDEWEEIEGDGIASDGGGEEKKDEGLNPGHHGAAENFSAGDGPARDGGDEDILEEAFTAVFDDGDGGKDRGEEEDEGDGSWHVVEHEALSIGPAESPVHAGAEEKPEEDGLTEPAHDAVALSEEAGPFPFGEHPDDAEGGGGLGGGVHGEVSSQNRCPVRATKTSSRLGRAMVIASI